MLLGFFSFEENILQQGRFILKRIFFQSQKNDNFSKAMCLQKLNLCAFFISFYISFLLNYIVFKFILLAGRRWKSLTYIESTQHKLSLKCDF